MDKKKKIQEYVIIILASLFVGLIAGRAAAAELNAAGPAQVVAGTAKGALFFNATSVSGLPVAVLLYSSDGSEFWIRRGNGSATLETVPINVPAGSSIIMPVGGYKATADTFKVKLFISAVSVAAGDSVFAIPMYR